MIITHSYMSLKQFIILIAVITLSYKTIISADIISNTGRIKFDINFDNSAEMTLDSDGLNVGTNANTQLQVSGNSVVGETSHTKHLNVSGAMKLTHETISNGLLSLEKSHYLINSSGAGNLTLELPSASDHVGKVLYFKSLYSGDNTIISAPGGIDTRGDIVLEDGDYSSLISDGNHWYIYNSSSSMASMITNDSRPLYFEFDNTTSDSSSSESTVTFNGAAASFSTGIRGQAIDFNGTDQYLEIPDDNKLDIEQNLATFLLVKPLI